MTATTPNTTSKPTAAPAPSAAPAVAWPEPAAGGDYTRNADGTLTCVQAAAAPAPMRPRAQATVTPSTTESPEE